MTGHLFNFLHFQKVYFSSTKKEERTLTSYQVITLLCLGEWGWGRVACSKLGAHLKLLWPSGWAFVRGGCLFE